MIRVRGAGVVGVVVALAAAASSLVPAGAAASTGELAYEECITGETQSGPGGSGACAQIASATLGGISSGLDSLRSPAISPDGESLYAVSGNDDAIARFTRDPATGELAYEDCVTGETQSGPVAGGGTGACEAIGSATSGGANSGLDFPNAVAVSPDGESLYAVSQSDDAVSTFDRDPATGELSYQGCITGETQSGPVAGGGTGACAAVGSASSAGLNSGLELLLSIAVSPDGESLYAVSRDDDAVARFERDPGSGELAYVGCITAETESGPVAGGGTGACAAVGSATSFGANSGLDQPGSVAVSPAGESLYAVSQNDDAIARFTRDPATGELAYDDCITGETESGPVAGGGTGACEAIGSATSAGSNSGLDFLGSAAVSPDGESLYASPFSDDAVATFDRDPATGALTYQGCITGETESGPVAGGGTGACAAIGSATSGGTNSGLDQLNSPAVSPDGDSVYAVSGSAAPTVGDDAIARFTRDPATGELAYEDCITGEIESGPVAGGGTGACAAIGSATSAGTNSGLDQPNSVAVSPDGESLYSAAFGDDAVARFSRELPPEPALSVSDESVLEGDAGETAAEFEVTLSNGSPDPIRVEARTEDGFATAPSDYASRTETIRFAPGDVSETFSVAVKGDTAVEPDETFHVRLANAQGATIDGDGKGTIENDDPSGGGATGELAYLDCITGETESGPVAGGGSGACDAITSATSTGTNSGLGSLEAIVLSPDGQSAYATSGDDDAVARFSRDPATGELTYEECITGETESGPGGSGACAAIPSATAGGASSGLDFPRAVAISPDGESLYATSSGSTGDAAIARFSRDPATGELTYEDCITSETESGPAGSGACDAIPSATTGGASSGLDGPEAVAVSPDGESVYATASTDAAIARFSRDPDTGELTYEDCITGEAQSGPGGSGACAATPVTTSNGTDSGLAQMEGLVATPDGESLYASSLTDAAISSFSRDPATGELTYENCITGETLSGPGGSGACAAIPSATANGNNSGLSGLEGIAASPDGGSIYAATRGDAAVSRFSRDPATGELAYEECISGEIESGPVPGGSRACEAIPSATAGGVSSGLFFPRAVAVSPDGESLYAAAGADADAAIARFSRDPETGELAYEDCIAGATESGPTGTAACDAIPSAASLGANSGLSGLRGVAVSPDGESLYASAGGDSAVSRFARNLPPEPALSITDVTVTEGDAGQTQATWEITLSNGSVDAVRVEADTDDGSATAGEDYGPRAETVTIPAGHVSKAFPVSVNGDTAFEPDETFLVRLAGAQGATTGDRLGLGTIENDDPAPPGTPAADPPETTITTGPVGTTNDETPVFEFTADEPATFECRLDSDRERDFVGCTSPHAVGLVADGPHAFEVRAIDTVGEVDPTPAVRTFSVSTTGCRGQVATIVGTEGPDRITGTAADDVIVTFAGDDRVTAGTGNDRICSGGDDDIVNAGGGDDQANSGSGDDVLRGDAGADILTGGGGEDAVNGEDGADQAQGGAGDDAVTGGADSDVLRGGSDDDLLNGADAVDQLFGGSGEDTLSGDAGADTLRGNSGDDTLSGAGGDDELEGSSGDDTANGGTGADELDGGSGDDRLNGEVDDDTLRGGGDDDALDGGAATDSCAGGSGENSFNQCE